MCEWASTVFHRSRSFYPRGKNRFTLSILFTGENMADIAKTLTTEGKRTIIIQGMKLTVDPAVMDDMRVMNWLYTIQHPDDDQDGVLVMVPLIHTLFGKDYQKIMDHLAEEGGRIPMQKVASFLTEFMSKVNPNS